MVGRLAGWLLACTLAASTAAQAQLSGRVTDYRTSQPLANAAVVLIGTLHATTTDSTGTYVFSLVPEGAFVLEATAPGYQAMRRRVELGAGPSRVNLALLLDGTGVPEHNPLLQHHQGPLRWAAGVHASRLSALEWAYGLRGLESDVYLGGIRLLLPEAVDDHTPLTLMHIQSRAVLARGPYGLAYGVGGVHFDALNEAATSALVEYDGGTDALHSSLTVQHPVQRGFAAVSGAYVTAGDYRAAGGMRQPGRAAAGWIMAQTAMDLGKDNHVHARAAWNGQGPNASRREGFIWYRYRREDGLLRGIAAAASSQLLHRRVRATQQSAQLQATLAPDRVWRLDAGGDLYRTGSEIDAGIYVQAAHALRRGAQFAAIRKQLASRSWGVEYGLVRPIGRGLDVVFGLGRAPWPGLDEPLRQIDAGLRWRRVFQAQVYLRSTRARGIELEFTRTRRRLQLTAAGSVLNGAARRSRGWARAAAVWSLGPMRIGTDAFGAGRAEDQPAWVNADVWLHLRMLSTLSVQIGLNNVANADYRWSIASHLAEPGRAWFLRIAHGK